MEEVDQFAGRRGGRTVSNERPNGARTVCTFEPVQQLYEAALEALVRDEITPRLEKAIQAIEVAAQESDNLDHVRQQAGHLYGGSSEGLEVTVCDFVYHNETDGWWCNAWLYVADPDSDEEDDP
jgi:hypothetical protein